MSFLRDVALAQNQCLIFGTEDMLFEGIFGWGKPCCWLVRFHGHGVASRVTGSSALRKLNRSATDVGGWSTCPSLVHRFLRHVVEVEMQMRQLL